MKQNTKSDGGLYFYQRSPEHFDKCVSDLGAALRIDTFSKTDILELLPYRPWQDPDTGRRELLDSIRLEILAAYARAQMAKYEQLPDMEQRALGKYHAERLFEEARTAWLYFAQGGCDTDNYNLHIAWPRVWSAFEALHSGGWSDLHEYFPDDFKSWKEASRHLPLY